MQINCMRTYYLIRLDDACPTMEVDKWSRVESILDKYHICPMVGIIPENKNPHEMISPVDSNFWEKARKWQEKGWAIALHGYDHCYISDKGLEGLNPLWARSEFAGLPLDNQKEKIKLGVKILTEKGIKADYFFAPSHTYDKNTLIALKEESDICYISDTIGCHPYIEGDFTFIPVLGGKCSKRYIPGEWTFCLHPNTMNESAFKELESFLARYSYRFISFEELLRKPIKQKGLFSRLLSKSYFLYRRIRQIH